VGRLRLHDGAAAIATSGQLAGLARVAFEAQTGEFNADVKQAESVYRDATRGMSDDAIRLELSQERLRRELAKGPGNYRAIARAELEVRRSEATLRGENMQLERQFNETRRAGDRMGRGMLAGSGALRGLGRNLAFASAGFLGGAGLVYGIKTAIGAASNLEEQTNKVGVTFGAAGQQVVAWSKTTATGLGIASDQALQYAGTLGGILKASGLTRTESAGLSTELVGLASDMASFNNASISDTLDAIRSGLVGESEPLRRFQVLLTEANVSQEAMRMSGKKTVAELTQGDKVLARRSLILKQTIDQQGDYARTSDGLANSQRTLSALWREANILVGQALVPSYTEAVQAARDWLSEDKNREQLQRQVNTVVRDGVQVVRAMATAMKLAVNIAEPLVKLVGGLGNAVEILTVAWVAWKVKSVLSFGQTAAASRVASVRMVEDATVAGRAWDVATRPRVMTVTTVGRGGVPGVGGVGGGKGVLGKLGGLVGLGPGGLIVAGAAATAYFGIRSGQKDPISDSEWARLKQAARKGTITYDQILDAPDMIFTGDRKGELLQIAADRMARLHPGAGPHRLPPKGGGGKGGGKKGGGFTLTAFEAQQSGLQELQLDAETTGTTSDDVRLAKSELALIRRALSELELTRDQRMTLKQRRNALLSQLASIEAQEEQEAQAIREKRAAAAKARRDKIEAAQAKEQAAEEAHMAKVMKRAEAYYDRMAKATKGIDFTTRAGLRKAALRYIDPKTGKMKGAKDDDQPLTEKELRRMLFDFASGLHGVLDQFGSNVGDSAGDYGMAATHSQLQTIELTKQTRILEEFTGAVRHPMTGYHRTEGTTTLLGVGF